MKCRGSLEVGVQDLGSTLCEVTGASQREP